VAPGLAALVAEKVWSTPPRGRRHPAEERLVADAQRLWLEVAGHKVAVFSWGEGPAALLVHGWGGRGTQLGSFVPALRARGFRVLAFDAPGHGDTPGGDPSLPLMAQVIEAIGRHAGGVQAIVAHSFGAAAATLAMHRGLDARAAVFFGPAADVMEASKRFARLVGIAPHVRDEMQRRMERRYSISFEELRVPRLVSRIPTPLLLIHDEQDPEVPLEEGRAVADAWPRVELMVTSGLGHYRVLRDPAVVEKAATFLAQARHT
jgi:pimeloyl-ACP methyl ester carboxylesterase